MTRPSDGPSRRAPRRRGVTLALVVALVGCERTTAERPVTAPRLASPSSSASPSPSASPSASLTKPRVPLHRPKAPTCSNAKVKGDPRLKAKGCQTDAACTNGRNGRCAPESYEGAYPNVCYYDGCYSDGDCGAARACECGAGVAHIPHRCVPAECRTDADCGAGSYCSPTYTDCSGVSGWYCRTAKDTCLDDADCGTYEGCLFDNSKGRWTCAHKSGCM